jgi:hypothetical protein
MLPGPASLISKGVHSIHIAQYGKVVLMSNHYRSEPAPYISDRLVHPPLDLFADLPTLCCRSPAGRLPQNNIVALLNLVRPPFTWSDPFLLSLPLPAAC